MKREEFMKRLRDGIEMMYPMDFDVDVDIDSIRLTGNEDGEAELAYDYVVIGRDQPFRYTDFASITLEALLEIVCDD
jgi:hypothetical protein